MINTVVNMPSAFYGDSITAALEQTGNFRVRNLSQSAPMAVEAAIRETDADILLMGVSVVSGFTLAAREKISRRTRIAFPRCKIVLLVDERVSEAQTAGVKALAQVRLADDFLYASGSMDYLVAKLETIYDYMSQ